MRMTRVSHDDMKKHKRAFNKISRLTERVDENIRNRNVYDETYDFTINTNNGRLIEDGDYHSYTFLVTQNPNLYQGSAAQLQHQYMTVFADSMVNSLAIIGQDLGYSTNFPQLNPDYLNALVWSGSFQGLEAFGDRFDFIQQQYIHHTGLAEITNSPSGRYQIIDNNGNIKNVIANPVARQINNNSIP